MTGAREVAEREHQVRDGERILQFDGDLLAESTSHRRGQTRWIEFKLYRTKAGSYILSRVGNSIVFHGRGCSLVSQYRLKSGDVAVDAAPCESCSPHHDEDELFPERIRYWAQVMEQPTSVLEALYKYDSDGAKYMTLVAQRLLSQASRVDTRIAGAYNVEVVA